MVSHFNSVCTFFLPSLRMQVWTNWVQKISLEFNVEIIHYQIIVITRHEIIFYQNSSLDCLFGSASIITDRLRTEFSWIETLKQDCDRNVLAFEFDTFKCIHNSAKRRKCCYGGKKEDPCFKYIFVFQLLIFIHYSFIY